MGVADDQPDPVEPAAAQGSQKVRPERLCLRRADTQPDNFPAAFGVGSHSDYGCDRNDPSALPLLEICGVEPDIGPVAGQRAVQKLTNALVDVFTQL